MIQWERMWILSLTGTVNAAHSQGWVQLVVLPSLHWYVRTWFCGKASTSYLLKLPLVFTKEKKKNYFLPNLKRAVVLLHHQVQAHALLQTEPSTHRPTWGTTKPQQHICRTALLHRGKHRMGGNNKKKLKCKALCVTSCTANTAG